VIAVSKIHAYRIAKAKNDARGKIPIAAEITKTRSTV